MAFEQSCLKDNPFLIMASFQLLVSEGRILMVLWVEYVTCVSLLLTPRLVHRSRRHAAPVHAVELDVISRKELIVN